MKLHAVTAVCSVQLSEGFQSDKSKAKYILSLFAINVLSFSLVEGHIPNKRQDGGCLQTTFVL